MKEGRGDAIKAVRKGKNRGLGGTVLEKIFSVERSSEHSS